jgi:hypothetical protein
MSMKAAALLACACVLAACTSSPGTTSSDDFEERLATWRAAEPQQYSWTLEWSEPVLGPRRTRIFVRDGVAVRAVSDGRELQIRGGEVNHAPATVEALIEFLVRYADGAARLDVRWAEDGYPSRIFIDHTEAAVDDEAIFTVVRFQRRDDGA